jgi:hypothetical protein
MLLLMQYQPLQYSMMSTFHWLSATTFNAAEERCSRLNKSLHRLAEHNDQIFE